MEICWMDQGAKGFLSQMTWIHFGVKAMFITARGAFEEFNLIIRPLTCCLVRGGLREKAFNFAFIYSTTVICIFFFFFFLVCVFLCPKKKKSSF